MKFLWLLLAAALPAAAMAEPTTYDLAPESTLSYFVHHPMHDVRADSDKVRVLKRPTYDPAAPLDVSGIREIPVQAAWADFSSGNANRDANTSVIVKASQFPTITYVIESVGELQPAGDGTHAGIAAGRLYVAGQKQPVTAAVEIDIRDPARVEVRGTAHFNMSAFGIEPPKLLLVAADDEVRVDTRLIFVPAPPGDDAAK